ncbi:molybdate ABC transporter substrate-binding protein [Shewanella intestini]|uniref:Molybdate ABC transporter substrate-binding protein n=1 Tax=Shewanella intestini TaxID=2017544 RepID=A0ABS5I5Q1_9GAMM|nr:MULTISPECIES: molybdate ABC transporter substrate-binding protein [Shewanella]MBR9729326.1 molybdate ABC transporter substrate-binding protein [Shewanella intestini]MRG37405.1 molybdate ABC transporter substrate-binding protein [Shewanella sp. XMDDZSB0408]
MNKQGFMGKSLAALMVVLGCVFTFSATASDNDVPAIAAASSIQFALDDISKQFTKDTGKHVRISYGSSGNFVAQIKHGAPFELFLSADARYTEQVKNADLGEGDSVIYAVGKLVVAAPKNSQLTIDGNLKGLTQLLKSGKLSRFTIANPQHAPYGERAQEVLENLGLWQQIQPNLVFGENVSQAAQFALSGSTDGGLVAMSLASADRFKKVAQYIEIPQKLYTPLNQKMLLLKKSGATAHAFYQYLQTPTAHAIFKKYGFGVGK